MKGVTLPALGGLIFNCNSGRHVNSHGVRAPNPDADETVMYTTRIMQELFSSFFWR